MFVRKVMFACLLVAVMLLVRPLESGAGPSSDALRVKGSVQQVKLIHQVRPVYPPEAKKAGIEGLVQLDALIDKEGNVAELEVVSGPEALVQAAVDAVRQWRYEPTYVDGKAVEVRTRIDVNFVLAKK